MKVWKYPLELTESQYIENVPIGTEVLHLDFQGDHQICLWVKVPRIYSSVVSRLEIQCFGTGWEIPDDLEHIGTVVMRDLTVWHYFWNPKHLTY